MRKTHGVGFLWSFLLIFLSIQLSVDGFKIPSLLKTAHSLSQISKIKKPERPIGKDENVIRNYVPLSESENAGHQKTRHRDIFSSYSPKRQHYKPFSSLSQADRERLFAPPNRPLRNSRMTQAPKANIDAKKLIIRPIGK